MEEISEQRPNTPDHESLFPDDTSRIPIDVPEPTLIPINTDDFSGITRIPVRISCNNGIISVEIRTEEATEESNEGYVLEQMLFSFRKGNDDFPIESLKTIDMQKILKLSSKTLWNIFYDHPYPHVIDYMARNCLNVQNVGEDNRFIDYVCMAGKIETVKYLIEEKNFTFDHKTSKTSKEVNNVLLSACLNQYVDEETYLCSGVQIFDYFLERGLKITNEDFIEFLQIIIVSNNEQFIDYFVNRGFELDCSLSGKRAIYRIVKHCNVSFLKKYLKYTRIGLRDQSILMKKIKDSDYESELEPFLKEFFDTQRLMIY